MYAILIRCRNFFAKYGKIVYIGELELNIPIIANMRVKRVYNWLTWWYCGCSFTIIGLDKKTVHIP